jgi:ankyrin repeat protein
LTLFNPGSRLLDRSTALILAAMYGHTLVVEQLIAAGAFLDVQNN